MEVIALSGSDSGPRMGRDGVRRLADTGTGVMGRVFEDLGSTLSGRSPGKRWGEGEGKGLKGPEKEKERLLAPMRAAPGNIH